MRETNLDHSSPLGPAATALLDEISTRWSQITNPLQFILRYAPAVRRYLAALIKDPNDAEDVAQTFLLRMVSKPVTPERVPHGRFRDYLKAVLRHAAIDLYRQRASSPAGKANLDQLPAVEPAADRVWIAEWRECLLQRAWDRLESHEREAPDSLAYTTLRLAADHPTEDSSALAARATALSGRTVRPEAFRKQLSRARRRFAQLLVEEIRLELEQPTGAEVAEELRDLGLMEYVRDFLPKSFQAQ
jgi:RNA polymerase sigma-70 factor (ECF subfamily)